MATVMCVLAADEDPDADADVAGAELAGVELVDELVTEQPASKAAATAAGSTVRAVRLGRLRGDTENSDISSLPVSDVRRFGHD
jgi:hypothetical protein